MDMNPDEATLSPDSSAPAEDALMRRRAPLLFLCVLVIATCGLIYELVAGTLAC